MPENAPSLVGRERERGVLREHLTAARAGRGSLVLIGGEAGIGKTALAELTCREAEQQGALVLVGRCYDLSETPPYGPWVELLGHYRPTDDLPPLPDAFAQRGTVGAVASEAALFQQVQGFFAAVATHRPLMLLLDDLHWADPASLGLLRFLSRSLSALPTLLIVTYRSDELTRRHPLYQLLPLLERESHATRLDLRRLPADAVRALVGRYRLPEADRERLVTHLQARAEGNAFFTTQLLRALEEEQMLTPGVDGWTLGDLAHVQVPVPLKQVIDGRLMRLGEDAQRLLTMAAVIGQEVPLTLWATVAETDEEALLTVIEQGAAAHLIEETPDGAQARFIHALIREAVYESILPSQRRRVHRQAGQTLAVLPNPDPDAVAYHFQRANDARAAEWFVTAGERAQRAYAWTTATERYEAALALWGDTGDAGSRARLLYQVARLRRFLDPRQGVEYCQEAERLANQVADRALVAAAHFSRGHCRVYLGNDIDRALDEMATGADLLEALSPEEQTRLGYPPGEDGTPTITLCRGQVILTLQSKGRFAEAIALGERYAAAAPNLTTLGELGRSHYSDREHGLALAYAMLGRPDAAHDTFGLARAALRDAEHYASLGAAIFHEMRGVQLPYRGDRIDERHRLAAAGEEAWRRGSGGTNDPPRLAWMHVLFLEGEWAEARALAVAEGAGTLVYQQIYAIGTLGPLARAQGEPELAWPIVRRLLPAGPATVPGTLEFFDTQVMQRSAAALSLDVGDLTTAKAWLEAHDRWLDWSGAILGQSEGEALWAEFYRSLRDTGQAYVHARQALTHATEPRQPLALIIAHRILGELDTDAGRFDDAGSHLTASLALADACAAPFERALTLHALAELRGATGDATAATALLDQVRAICAPLGATPTLARADALTARLATMKDAPPAFPAGLSPREVEVLRLVANGRTNREIADALFLSEHTVRVHVRNILTKTDAANRTEAATFALRHALA